MTVSDLKEGRESEVCRDNIYGNNFPYFRKSVSTAEVYSIPPHYHNSHMFAGCPSCCLDCGPNTLISTPSNDSAFALANLLPAGTLHLSLILNNYICDHSHLEDGWHALRTDLVLQNLMSEEDDSLIREMAFLIKHAFISCSCRLSHNGNSLTIRVYLIPYDLSNVQGRLRVRDESTVLAPSRRYLKALLQRLAQDSDLWEGAEVNPHTAPSPFIPHEKVS